MRIDSSGIGWSVVDGNVFYHLPKEDRNGVRSWGPPCYIDRDNLDYYFRDTTNALVNERHDLIVTLFVLAEMKEPDSP